MTIAIDVLDGTVIEVEYNFRDKELGYWSIVSVEGNKDPSLIQEFWDRLADTPGEHFKIHKAIYDYESGEAETNLYNSGEDQ